MAFSDLDLDNFINRQRTTQFSNPLMQVQIIMKQFSNKQFNIILTSENVLKLSLQ